MIDKPFANLSLTLLMLLPLATPQVDAHGIVRREQPGLPIASSITVPAGAELMFIGGTLADVTSDYQYLEVVRTVFKAVRKVERVAPGGPHTHRRR